MTTLTDPFVLAREAPQPLRSVPSWQVVLAGPIAEVVAALRSAGCAIRLTAGCLDASGPLSAGQALRALRRRCLAVERYLATEPATEGD
jgi:hypothetical protein